MDKFRGNRRQIVKKIKVPAGRVLSCVFFAFPGLYQNWLRVDGSGGFQVTESIADEP